MRLGARSRVVRVNLDRDPGLASARTVYSSLVHEAVVHPDARQVASASGAISVVRMKFVCEANRNRARRWPVSCTRNFRPRSPGPNSANGLNGNNYHHMKLGLHDGMRRRPDGQAWQVIIGGVPTDAANGFLMNGRSFYG